MEKEEMRRDIAGNWHYHTENCPICNPKYQITISNTTQPNDGTPAQITNKNG